MRFTHPDGSVVHLAYCTNMHPAEDLDGIISQLHTFAGPVREHLNWPVLGVGLWLSAEVAALLASDRDSLRRLRATLDELHVECVTLNGFPYAGFQNENVKLAVYRPDWAERERLEYTLNLGRILQALLPDDVYEGSISTLPLGWRTRDVPNDLVLEAAAGLPDGIRLAIEPEPGCIIETMTHGIDVVSALATPNVGMCLDACHLAVQFETASTVLAQAADANVPIVKAQISNALRVPDADDTQWVNDFIEPRFMHQARQESANGLVSVDDLDRQTAAVLRGDTEWRVHFHVPLNMQDTQNHTTQPELRDTIRALVGGEHPSTRHLEVETYTWTVLPEGQRPQNAAGLVLGIAGELQWTFDQLTSLALEPQL